MNIKSLSKLTLLTALLCGGASTAWADTTIGATDNTSGAWAQNKYYPLKSNQTLHVEFVNHNAGSGNSWNNFLIRFTDDETPTNTYGCYRADNFGWGTCYDGGGTVLAPESDFGFDSPLDIIEQPLPDVNDILK